ncbi:probable RNA polymerase II nuclear localization protein SLC7A6OS [Ctenocephalides felis]|uniref:probable RNA polymerase II nuclear localization protein SLC7A6OS n=1 Tax=Ctenocephalides felis TaxID=7515 RepID=UPI000E6E3CCA|nr:probable RNA polymerase II nuclear localization protein SLC7A6OS [Ctenocephalides felis]
MAAVIRVKRRIFDEPVDSLVINCKRRKTDDTDSETSVSALIKLATTLKNENENISAHLSKITKEEAKKTFKRHIPNITTKLRNEQKLQAQNNRFKVINCFRTLDDSKEASNGEKNQLTVVDIEQKMEANNIFLLESETKLTTNYVYDLYYMDEVDDMILDNMLSIHEATDDLVFGTFREGGYKSSDDYDTDDSNDENNYRNDYPDSDNSINVGVMRKAIGDLSLGEDLSSDEGEGFIYSVDSEGFAFEGDVDDDDKQRYGEKYARYKSRVLKELNDTETDSDNEREDYYDCLNYEESD